MRPSVRSSFARKTSFKKLTTNFVVPIGAESEKIEFLADGQQLVAHGIHPDTQGAYTWIGGDPTTIAYADLPEITAEEAERAAGRYRRDAGAGLRLRHHARGPEEEVDHSRARPRARIRNAIGHGPRRRSTPNARRSRAQRLAIATRSSISAPITSTRSFTATPGLLDENEVRRRLFAAAEACGLVNDDGADSAWRTIESGCEGAKTQPRVRPLAKLDQPAAACAMRRSRPGECQRGFRQCELRCSGCTGEPGARQPGMRQVIQLIEGERHRIVDEAEEALIAAGGFDIYQRDAVMMRPVMHRLPAAHRHGIKRSTVVWRLMRVKPLYLIEMLGRVCQFPELRPPSQGLGR